MDPRLVARRVAESLRLSWQARRQRYHVEYRAELSNPGAQPVTATVVCPLPPTFPSQQIGSITYSVTPDGEGADPLTHNRYAWWTLAVAGLGRAGLSLRFSATVNPRFFSREPRHKNPAAWSAVENRYIVVNDQVRQIARTVTSTASSELAVVSRLYTYVVLHLHYGRRIPGLYSSQTALKKRTVDCGGFCTLLAALLAAGRIPSRLLVGWLVGYPKNSMHVWLESRLSDGRWIALDPSNDHLARTGRDKKSGRFGFVGSDRIVFSVGADLQLPIGQTALSAAILQHPLVINPPGVNVTASAEVTASRQ